MRKFAFKLIIELRFLIPILLLLITESALAQGKILNSIRKDSIGHAVYTKENYLLRNKSSISAREKEYYKGNYNPATFTEESHEELKESIFWDEMKVIVSYSILVIIALSILFFYKRNKAKIKLHFIDKMNVGNYRIHIIISILISVLTLISCSRYKLFYYSFMMYDALNLPFNIIRPILLSVLAFILYWVIIFIGRWVKDGYVLHKD